MATQSDRVSRKRVMALAGRQRRRVTTAQLRGLGLSPSAVRHRIAKGILTPVARGVLLIGPPDDSREGVWMTAVLLGGPWAVLSHLPASVHWGYESWVESAPEISIPATSRKRPKGVIVHRRDRVLGTERRRRLDVPITSAALTIIDNAERWDVEKLEAAISEADARGHAKVATVRRVAGLYPMVPGSKIVRDLIDRKTFRLTRSQLERWLLPIVASLGLPVPLTRAMVNGWEVDFYWPELGLIVETDGGTFHRTPFQQNNDRRREHAHLLAGMTPVRFTHFQIRHEPDYVRDVLSRVAARLG